MSTATKPEKTGNFTLTTQDNAWVVETVQDRNATTATATIKLTSPSQGSDVANQREELLTLGNALIGINREGTLNVAKGGTQATFTVNFPAQPNFATSVEMALQPLGTIEKKAATITR